jgi:alanyl-tRNA synthetase
LLKCGQENIFEKVENLQQKIKTLETEIKSTNLNAAKDSGEKIVSNVKNGSKVSFSVCNLGITSKEVFTAIHDNISETIVAKNMNNVIICIIAEVAGAVMIAASADKTANANGVLCGNLVKKAAQKVGGGGGGSPTKAQAGGKNPNGIIDAIKELEELLK